MMRRFYMCSHDFRDYFEFHGWDLNFISKNSHGWEIGFGVFSATCLYLKLLENGKSTVLKIIFNCYKGFCPLKPEIARFPIAFHLKNF